MDPRPTPRTRAVLDLRECQQNLLTLVAAMGNELRHGDGADIEKIKRFLHGFRKVVESADQAISSYEKH